MFSISIQNNWITHGNFSPCQIIIRLQTSTSRIVTLTRSVFIDPYDQITCVSHELFIGPESVCTYMLFWICACVHACICALYMHAWRSTLFSVACWLYSVLHRAVRSIACELHVVQRSVSRVTLAHFCRPIYRNLDLYDCCAKD